MEATTIEKAKILAVEGKDERNFFEALMDHIGVNDIQVIDICGETNFKHRLKALAETSDFKAKVTSLGVVRDADSDYSSAFQSIQNALRKAKLSVPTRPMQTCGDSPRITIMILPRENATGMLEDVCLEAVASDSAFPCVGNFFGCLTENNINLSQNVSKAEVQTFLASRAETISSLGVAAKKGYWPWESTAFNEIKAFLRSI